MTGVLLLQWQQICSRRIVASQYIPLCPKAFLPPTKMLKDMVFLNNSWQMSFFWTRGPLYPQKTMFSQNFILRGSTRPKKTNINKQTHRNSIMGINKKHYKGIHHYTILYSFSLARSPSSTSSIPWTPSPTAWSPCCCRSSRRSHRRRWRSRTARRGGAWIGCCRASRWARRRNCYRWEIWDLEKWPVLAKQRWQRKILHEWRL